LASDDRDPRTSALARRDFVKLGALGGVAAVSGVAAGCNSPDATGGPVSADALTPAPASDLDELTIDQLRGGMADRWLTPDLAQLYLDRIAAYDKRGPGLNSIIELNPDALEIAQQLDDERAAGKERSLLHGMPVLLKDNIDTGDKMQTTAGSLALEGSSAPRDAFVVEKLRAAGALILGKTNLSEWANFRSTRSSSGWSARGGQCGNAYAFDRSPCGSSSGSAAAVSANFCAVAIGTETSGSIVCPSSVNGVVGIKPTVGLVSRAGIIPISHTQDTAGPIARTVRDAALVLGLITGVDPRDPATNASQGKSYDDYLQFLDQNGLQGARIGVERTFFGQHPDVDAAMEAALSLMSSKGATIVDNANIPDRTRAADLSTEIMLWEIKTDLAAYLATRPDAKVKTLADVIAFNEENKAREMPFFGQERFLQAETKGALTDPGYLKILAEAQSLAREKGIDAVMEANQLDAIVAPSTRPSWKIDHINGGMTSASSAAPAATACYPNITVPCGSSLGLPFGISFWGRAWSEPTLIKLAYAFEQATHHRIKPGLVAALPESVGR
jgi:amidase